jgi:hypothetical protein
MTLTALLHSITINNHARIEMPKMNVVMGFGHRCRVVRFFRQLLYKQKCNFNPLFGAQQICSQTHANPPCPKPCNRPSLAEIA